MLEKVISGGETGVERAVLDAAIKWGIPHGGWIPKGRSTEEGPLPEHYLLQEMPTENDPARTEKNVMDSDGTLIISRGSPAGTSDLTRKMALKHGRQLLHIDLNQMPEFQAASLINSWIEMQKVKALNVAGPSARKDPEIYGATFKIIETVIQLNLVENVEAMKALLSQEERKFPDYAPPKTIEDAVDFLMKGLSLKDKVIISRLSFQDLFALYPTLGQLIRNDFRLWTGNDELLASCQSTSADDASAVIIEALWNRLRATHKLRKVK